MQNSPSKILALNSDVVDQIAAGEVVERPAHLVKELVENAIDSGASLIEIEFDQGGRRIRVTDDGGGIEPSDLSLALARHATSKINKADDLWSLSTFGFRGEALASIAAVSRLTLQSRPHSAEVAHRIQAEFGKLSATEPAGGNPGTTVLVEELFSNIPARLKFLKSESAEHAQIRTTLKALALSHENVEFRLRSKGKLEQIWKKATSFVERAEQVLEQTALYESRLSYQNYEAQVVFASPHHVTGNSRSILIFVQGRWVQDRSLQAAVIEAYRGLLMHGEYPVAIVRLRAPASEIDVNIHPTKSLVKFRDAQPAFRSVNRALREGLEKAPWLVRANASESPSAEEAAPVHKLSLAELTRPYQRDPVAAPLAASERAPQLSTAPVHSLGRFDSPEFNTIVFKQKNDQPPPDERKPSTETGLAGAWSRLQVLGQAHLTYILAQDQDRLVLIDQHAAHERVAYERLMRAWLSGEIEVQPLLLPITVELEPDGAESLLRIAPELEKLGVQLDQNGPQSVAIRAMPAMIKEGALTRSLQKLARESVERGGSFAFENKISDLCATMACHSVVRAGQALSVEQMKSLLVQMDEFALSSFCPHGRPVSVDYPFAKLERDFGRLV